MIACVLLGGYQQRKSVDPKLITPLFDHKFFRCLPKSFRKWMWCGLDREEMDEDLKVGCDSMNRRKFILHATRTSISRFSRFTYRVYPKLGLVGCSPKYKMSAFCSTVRHDWNIL